MKGKIRMNKIEAKKRLQNNIPDIPLISDK